MSNTQTAIQDAPGLALYSTSSLTNICNLSCLMLDPLTLKGLQIFQEEGHPSAMGIGRAKEGFSVYGMFNQCVTNLVGYLVHGLSVL